MIVRTYGRRSYKPPIPRTGSYNNTDSLNDIASSQETSQDFCNGYNHNFNFSSQESTSLWSQQDPFNFDAQNDPFDFDSQNDPFDFDSQNNAAAAAAAANKNSKRKRQKTGKRDREVVERERLNKSKRVRGSGPLMIPATSTLMEAQEFGEMMEHVDEVNFALDGLRKGQPLRIRRASLLSLLSICSTTQQRRLLRSQGMAKSIIDAILGLSFDDSSSNLAAAALFYALTSDGQDDHLLELPSCIHFLIKCLKPITSITTEDKARKIGSKLLALCKDIDVSRDATKMSDSSSAAIFSKVQDILISCKEMKCNSVVDSGVKRPEFDPKWIALLTVEKACLSKISFEDTTGTVRKTGGNFKEKLRELGGLDAIFEVTLNCHSEMEGWLGRSSASVQALKDNSDLQSLALLLKCLKIMENATFLSKDNQSHLLGMEGNLDSYGSRITFTKLVMSIIKILSGRYLLKSSATSSDDKSNCCSNGTIADHKVESNEPIFISSSKDSSSVELASSEKSLSMSWDSPWLSTAQLVHAICSTEPTTTSMNDSCSQEMRVSSAISSSCSGMLRSLKNGIPATSNGSRTSSVFGFDEIANDSRDSRYEHLQESQDPFAFDEDDFEPSKWDILSGKQKNFGTQKSGLKRQQCKGGCEYPLVMSQQETGSRETCLQEAHNKEVHHSRELPCSSAADEEISSLLGDCLLTAIKVLMNLTNDNPVGCRQIAACGGLETMSSLIASHFPLFSSSVSSYREIKEDTVSIVLDDQNDKNLTDQELDFLVAILGLLVNLVEKDGHNRSRLAAASVPLPNSDGLEEEDSNVIPLLCSIFLANRGAGDTVGEGKELTWNDEEALLEGEKEAEKMIVEAYAALLLAFLSTESKCIRDAITECLPNHNLRILVPVLERFVAFHLSLNMISPETHKAVSEVIESCRVP